MRTARQFCCAGAALILLGAVPSRSLHGQNQQPAAPQATFRATTALVEVDVIAFDDKGRFVPGLTADDLALLEDGKPQTIQQFYMVTHDGTAAANPTVTANTAQAESRAHRVFVMLFDEEHLANDSLHRVKKGAEEFIRDQLRPGDIAGVFVNGEMYKGRLTSDKIELSLGVRAVKPAFDNRQALLAGFRQFPRIPGEIDAARIADGARELVDQLGIQACNDDPFLCQAAGGLQVVENQIERKARDYIRHARVLTARTVQNLQYVVGRLSRIPGRKTLVFLSEGFFVEESRAMLQTVAAQAARAGTAIYSIDGRGLIHGSSGIPDVLRPETARSTVFDTGEDGPTILTAGTGGFRVSNIDDISRAFGLIVRDTSTYYVIGYQPDNKVMDGKFRKIEVKTKVDGLNLRARKGYLAVALPPLESIRGGGD
ncbi:MAG TPA: VWA domain-containing protein [Vicinamibacterales bacterium]|nr:VWA domain-containing protein [Vicinamibacterales bacterium]